MSLIADCTRIYSKCVKYMKRMTERLSILNQHWIDVLFDKNESPVNSSERWSSDMREDYAIGLYLYSVIEPASMLQDACIFFLTLICIIFFLANSISIISSQCKNSVILI